VGAGFAWIFPKESEILFVKSGILFVSLPHVA